MRIDNGRTDIFYKGHGLIERATPSDSVGHVLLHELRHLQEFQNKAQATSREVINPRISIDYEFRDGKLVAVSGEATARLVPERDEGVGVHRSGPTEVKGPEDAAASDSGSVKAPEAAGADEKLDQTLKKLKSIKERVENKLERMKAKSDDEGPAGLKASEKDQRTGYLNDRLRMLDFLINRLEAEKSAELQEGLLKKLLDADGVLGLVQAAHGYTGKEKTRHDGTEGPSQIKDRSIPGLVVDVIV